MKQIKDYARLYIGQSIVSYWGKTKEINTIVGMIGDLCVLCYNDEDGVESSLDLSFNFEKGKEPKLILRPIDSITEAEARECYEIIHKIKSTGNKVDVMEYIEGTLNDHMIPEVVHWATKKGFDIFELIKEGIAIKK